MTAPNAELAYRVYDTAMANRAHLDMSEWANGTVGQADGTVGLDDLTAEGGCGTTACYAGWTVAINGYRVSPDGRVFDSSGCDVGGVEALATDLLGITEDQASDLFFGSEYHLDEKVAEIFGPRPAVTS